MARPGDPQKPDRRPATPFGSSGVRAAAPAGGDGTSLDIPDPSDDDSVGFTSAGSLAGVSRGSLPTASPLGVQQDDEPEQAGLFDVPERHPARKPASRALAAAPAHVAAAVPDHFADPLLRQAEAPASEAGYIIDDLPVALASAAPGSRIRRSAGATSPVFGRASGPRSGPVETAEGAMGLYTVYALILFAIPTAGLAAVIALIAAVARPVPDQDLARSHYEFQKRTLVIAAIAALVGGAMIVVNLGVFVLVAVALWLIVRATWGLMSLVHGKTIADPYQWWIAARQTRKA